MWAFVEDIRAAHCNSRIGQPGLPLLVMHSPTDGTVDIENARAILRAVRHPRSSVTPQGSDHLLVARSHARRAARTLSARADQYAQAARTETPELPVGFHLRRLGAFAHRRWAHATFGSSAGLSTPGRPASAGALRTADAPSPVQGARRTPVAISRLGRRSAMCRAKQSRPCQVTGVRPLLH